MIYRRYTRFLFYEKLGFVPSNQFHNTESITILQLMRRIFWQIHGNIHNGEKIDFLSFRSPRFPLNSTKTTSTKILKNVSPSKVRERRKDDTEFIGFAMEAKILILNKLSFSTPTLTRLFSCLTPFLASFFSLPATSCFSSAE